MDKVINVTAAGLGGQGVLKVTDILAEVLFAEGYDVKKSEVHGMSQRGGSVSSEVRYGKKVFSPMVPEGEADILVILEPTQLEVNIDRMKSDGILINIADMDTSKLSNPKAANMMILGALSVHFPDVTKEIWLEHMFNNLPAKLHQVNEEAFKLGRG